MLIVFLENGCWIKQSMSAGISLWYTVALFPAIAYFGAKLVGSRSDSLHSVMLSTVVWEGDGYARWSQQQLYTHLQVCLTISTNISQEG